MVYYSFSCCSGCIRSCGSFHYTVKALLKGDNTKLLTVISTIKSLLSEVNLKPMMYVMFNCVKQKIQQKSWHICDIERLFIGGWACIILVGSKWAWVLHSILRRTVFSLQTLFCQYSPSSLGHWEATPSRLLWQHLLPQHWDSGRLQWICMERQQFEGYFDDTVLKMTSSRICSKTKAKMMLYNISLESGDIIIMSVVCQWQWFPANLDQLG